MTASSLDKVDVCRVMIVDDSAVIRNLIARVFGKNPAFEVSLTADNGASAVQKLRENPVDVIILDIDMPVMDGLKAIPQLKAIDPAVQIIMASTLTQKNAEISLHALTLGATDYIAKPSADTASTTSLDFSLELTEKVKVLGMLARQKGVRLTVERLGSTLTRSTPADGAKNKINLRPDNHVKPDIIAIGCSTGGPEALLRVIRQTGRDLPQPILITQHMPPTFTTILAEHIARQCDVVCREGKENETLQPGHYYIAPGDFHMRVAKAAGRLIVKLSQDARENFCRPAVDYMLRPLPGLFGNRILAIILTGMGVDGAKGSEAVVAAGGRVLAQNEETSVVWGMPGAVAVAGLCTAVLSIDDLGMAIRKMALEEKHDSRRI